MRRARERRRRARRRVFRSDRATVSPAVVAQSENRSAAAMDAAGKRRVARDMAFLWRGWGIRSGDRSDPSLRLAMPFPGVMIRTRRAGPRALPAASCSSDLRRTDLPCPGGRVHADNGFRMPGCACLRSSAAAGDLLAFPCHRVSARSWMACGTWSRPESAITFQGAQRAYAVFSGVRSEGISAEADPAKKRRISGAFCMRRLIVSINRKAGVTG